MSSSAMTASRALQTIYDDDDCPNYEAAVSRSNTNSTNAGSSVHWTKAAEELQQASGTFIPQRQGAIHRAASTSRLPPRPIVRRERYVYSYNMVAGSTPLQFHISVEPASGKQPGFYTFRLSLKANGIERSLAEPLDLKLAIDPKKLDFVVFIFPGKTSIPVGCVYSLRVWLRVNGIDHRVFGDDDLWIAKDPDFNSIADASFARLKKLNRNSQYYHGVVGRALVTFIVRWRLISGKLYQYSLEYEAGGVSSMLFEDFRMQIDGDPRTVTFSIYTVPMQSMPAGASHRLRVWLRSLSLGSKLIMGFSTGGPQTVIIDEPAEISAQRSDYDDKSRQGSEHSHYLH
ncbi:hypothetical protein BD779DRAFT_1492913 [Infundibulicybe gibba]|nr:hypothetical protein BD779DRAFT_1492913 [Infundibulicybe gibba]